VLRRFTVRIIIVVRPIHVFTGPRGVGMVIVAVLRRLLLRPLPALLACLRGRLGFVLVLTSHGDFTSRFD
jgi:hypothetical protein